MAKIFKRVGRELECRKKRQPPDMTIGNRICKSLKLGFLFASFSNFNRPWGFRQELPRTLKTMIMKFLKLWNSAYWTGLCFGGAISAPDPVLWFIFFIASLIQLRRFRKQLLIYLAPLEDEGPFQPLADLSEIAARVREPRPALQPISQASGTKA